MEEINKKENYKYNTTSILAFSSVFFFFPLGFVLGIIALSQIKKTNENGRGLAIASIVLGAIFFLFLIIFLGFIFPSLVREQHNINRENAQIDSKCLNTQVVPTRITNTTDNDFLVTVNRKSGEDEIGGVHLVLSNNDGTKIYSTDVPGNIETLKDKTASVTLPKGSVSNPDYVVVIVYFLDNVGKEQLCQNASNLKF